MAAGVAQRTIAWVDWNSLRSSYEFGTGRPFLQELGSSDDVPAVPEMRDPLDPSPALLQRLRAQADDDARAMLTSFVRGEVAAVLGLEPGRLMEPNQGFFKLGMDSLMTVDLRGRLERAVGLKLPTTIAFEYPTVESLSGYLADRLRVADAGSAGPAPTVEDLPEPDDASDRADAVLESLSETDLATMLDSAIAGLLDDEATAR